MPDLYITRTTPNPAGKDRTPANRVTINQLNGQWMEFENVTRQNVSLSNVKLAHYTFDDHCKKTSETNLVTSRRGCTIGVAGMNWSTIPTNTPTWRTSS